MFNFSANHLLLLSRTEYRKCAVFLLRDLDTQRVYRLYDFTKALLLRPGVAYSVAGKVNSADAGGWPDTNPRNPANCSAIS
jgi:hypothetical protein